MSQNQIMIQNLDKDDHEVDATGATITGDAFLA